MSKRTTRIIALVLIALMALALIPIAAYADPGQVTLYFDANGGDGNMPAQVNAAVGTDQISGNAFSRGGYTFSGWNTVAAPTNENPGRSFTDGQTIPADVNDESLTLYAQWTIINPQTVTFVGNAPDGATVTGSMDPQQVPGGVDTALNANDFTCVGFEFAGWNTVAAPTTENPGEEYLDEATVNTTEPLTLYAQWTPADLSGTVTVAPSSAAPGNVLTATVSDDCNNTGTLSYQWKRGDTEVGTNAASYTVVADDVGQTVTCVVTSSAQTGSRTSNGVSVSAAVTVTFNANAPTGATVSGTMDPQIMPNNVQTALTANAFTCVGYDFGGWATAADGNKAYDNAESVTLTTNTELFALWTPQSLTGTVTLSPTELMLGDTVTATVTETNNTGTLSYQWKVDGAAVTGNGASYTVAEGNQGKAITCVVTSSVQTGELVSNAVTPVVQITYPVNVTITGSGTVTVGTDTHDASFTVDVHRGDSVTLTLEPAAGNHVETVTVDGEAQTPALSYTVTPTGSMAVAVTFAGRASDAQPAVVVSELPMGAADIAVVGSPAAKALVQLEKDKKAAGLKLTDDRILHTLYDAVPCWNGNPTDPLSADELTAWISEHGGLDFLLPVPTGVTAERWAEYRFNAYHYNAAQDTFDAMSNFTASKDDLALRVKGQDAFSPFFVTATPIPLTGTVTVSGMSVVGCKLKATLTQSNADDLDTLSYQWMYWDETANSGAGEWKNIPGNDAEDAEYTVESNYANKKIKCVVTSNFKTGELSSREITPTAKPSLTAQYAVNNGDSSYDAELGAVFGNTNLSFAQLGTVYGVSDEMEWSPSASGPWTDVPANATTIPDLAPGTYYVRVKGMTNSANVASVTVDNYYTIVTGPDSVSANRGTVSSSVTPRYTGSNGLARVYMVKSGSSLSLTTTVTSTTNYRINQILRKNLFTAATTTTTPKTTTNTISVTANAPWTVVISIGATGAKTGDESHLGLWSTLATLSVLSLGAVLTLGRKKLG